MQRALRWECCNLSSAFAWSPCFCIPIWSRCNKHELRRHAQSVPMGKHSVPARVGRTCLRTALRSGMSSGCDLCWDIWRQPVPQRKPWRPRSQGACCKTQETNLISSLHLHEAPWNAQQMLHAPGLRGNVAKHETHLISALARSTMEHAPDARLLLRWQLSLGEQQVHAGGLK